MVLVDTSVWVAHLRHGEAELVELLNAGAIACHPFVIGELACGNLSRRDEILILLQALPGTVQAEPEEVLSFIESNMLMGVGLGYVDFHLLASAVLSDMLLWTADKRLSKAARTIGVGYRSEPISDEA
jgi:predicted nucleic acid-binding protein